MTFPRTCGLAGWVALGIPISFLGAFLAMVSRWTCRSTSSRCSRFIVTLGLVVDDAIVVGENIHTKHEQGVPPVRAAIEGLREVVAPVSVGVLTTILAFAPLYFTEGSSATSCGSCRSS